MRFSIFKTLSILHKHRRSKSESSAVHPVTSTQKARTRSLSVACIGELAYDPLSNVIFSTVAPDFPSITTPVPVPAPTSTSLVRAPPLMPILNVSSAATSHADGVDVSIPITPELFTVTQRILALEAQIAELKNANARLIFDAEIREEELAAFKGDYYAERSKSNIKRRQAQADHDKIECLERKLVQFERFIELMIDLGLHEPVLARAQCALRAGDSADEALVDSIREAAAKPGSPWSRIIPAVTGPRTSEQYLSAIELTLKTRVDLKKSTKVAKFWKKMAQEDGTHANIITPSSSDLSSIHEVLSEDRQTAVDDLLNKLRSGDIPIRRRVAVSNLSGAAPFPSIFPTTQGPRISPSPDVIPSTAEPESESACTVRKSIPSRSSRARTLEPLASQTFKEELVASHSSQRFSMAKLSRPILGSLDLNRLHNHVSSVPLVDSVSSDRLKPSAKALGKRKAMVMTESIESISASLRPTPIPIPTALPATTESILLAEDSFTKAISASVSTIDECFIRDGCSGTVPSHNSVGNGVHFDNSLVVDPVLSSGTKPSVSVPAVESGPINKDLISPQRALLSLERICAGFDSGSSLGSLDTINEVSESNSAQASSVKDISGIADSLLVAPTSTDCSPISQNNIQGADVSLAPKSSIDSSQQSRLPVFKRLRRLSRSGSLKRGSNSPLSRSVLQPTVSSALKVSKASPRVKKSRFNENRITPPLLIKNKTRYVGGPPTSPTTKSRISRVRVTSSPGKVVSPAGSGMLSMGKRAARTLSRIMS